MECKEDTFRFFSHHKNTHLEECRFRHLEDRRKGDRHRPVTPSTMPIASHWEVGDRLEVSVEDSEEDREEEWNEADSEAIVAA